MSAELAAKLAAIRAATKPFPVTAYLHIYNTCPHLLYINYMKEARNLATWLTDKGNVAMQYDLLAAPTNIKFPSYLTSYELYELAKIVAQYNNSVQCTHKIQRDIIYTYSMRGWQLCNPHPH